MRIEPSVAARLLYQAAIRAGSLRSLYSPDQPRDSHGQFAGSGILDAPSRLDVTKPVLGVVTVHGDVRMRNPTAAFNDHTQLFGSSHHPARRFAVNNSKVTWDEAPHPDDRHAVTNRLEKLGVTSVRHVELVGGRMLDALGVSNRDRTPTHEAADRNVKQLTVAIRYAFARGRQALGTADQAANAVKTALLDVLPSALLKCYIAGANVSQFKAAEFRALKPPPAKKIPPFTIRFDAKDPRAIAWAKEHAAELAKGLSETSRDAIKEAIAAGLDSKASIPEVRLAIREAVGSDARAELIARTETMRAAAEGLRGSWDAAVEKGLLPADTKRTWIATSDCCPICEELDGEEADLDGAYPDPGGDGPPAHPNSIIAGVLVEGNTIAATRMSYAGQVREIVMASGRTLTVTPNHAVATLRGFVPARQVEKGEYLLSYDERIEQRDITSDTFSSPVPVFPSPEDNQNGPAAIEQVFHTLELRGEPLRTERLGNEFHSDAAYGDGDIDIVYADIELRDSLETAFANQRKRLSLKLSNFSTAALGSTLLLDESLTVARSAFVPGLEVAVYPTEFSGISRAADFGPEFQELGGELSASHASRQRKTEQGFSGPVAEEQTFNVRRRPFSQPTTLRVGRTTQLDTVLLELQCEATARDAGFVCQLEERLAGFVARDEVLEVRDRDHFGHVYDLSTISGVIVAEGLIISNCRCTEGIAG